MNAVEIHGGSGRWPGAGGAPEEGAHHAARRIVVVGLGETGFSCVRFLRARGLHPVVVDTRTEPPQLARLRRELPEVPVVLGEFPADLLAEATEVVLSPGVDAGHPGLEPARRRGVPVVGDIELFCRSARAPVIAITGSNGKSTVTSLVGEMATAAGVAAGVGGNLGPPALDLLEGPVPAFFVLELSSFQLETTSSLDAHAAAVLNLAADHLDRHHDLETYAAAKRRILRGTGTMVLNDDDARVAAMAEAGRPVVRFSVRRSLATGWSLVAGPGGEWLARDRRARFPAAEVAMAGRHNLSNALAALALGEAAGLPEAAMRETLGRFRGLPHRCELVAQAHGVRWVNDSKATNVAAAVAAIDGLGAQSPLVLIAGGLDKGADFAPLAAALQGRARLVVLLGRDAGHIEAALAGHVPICRASDMEAAVRLARAEARTGDTVVLSPACASFDLYPGYAARGAHFAALVREELSR